MSDTELPPPNRAGTGESRVFSRWMRRGFADALSGAVNPEQAFASSAYGANAGYLEGFADGLIVLGEAYQNVARREAIMHQDRVAARYHALHGLGLEGDEPDDDGADNGTGLEYPAVEYPAEILAEPPQRRV